jgi:hypothetical protein
MWSEYKYRANNNSTAPTELTLSVVDEDDEWSGDDTALMADQLWLYEHEPHSKIKDSPITYWISKRSIWPQLAEMALDVYSTPCMSDEPERVFSTTGALLQPRRRTLKGDIVEQMICLQSWDRAGIIALSQGLCNSAVATASTRKDDDDDDEPAELNESNLQHLEQSYID